MIKSPISFEEILQDPSAIYDHPREVLNDSKLSKAQKLKVLQQWKYDAIQIQNCDGENMCGGERSHLDSILFCIHTLETEEESQE